LPGFSILNVKKLKFNKDGKIISSLTKNQKTSWKYRNKLLRYIPHREIVNIIANKIKRILKVRNMYKKFIITGSYRRGKNEGMKDIDILIIVTDQNKGYDITNKIKNKLNIYSDSYAEGLKKFSFLVKIKASIINKYIKSDTKKKYHNIVLYSDMDKYKVYNKEHYYIQIDIRYFIQSEYPYALMHFTGNYLFNTIIRSKAKEMGMKLNEYGLYNIKNEKQVNIDIKTEKDIIDYLGMDKKYYNPKNRNK